MVHWWVAKVEGVELWPSHGRRPSTVASGLVWWWAARAEGVEWWPSRGRKHGAVMGS